jgi:hypothetical protein
MDPKTRLEQRIGLLRKRFDAKIDRCELGPPLRSGEIEAIAPLVRHKLPRAHIDFLRAMNGVTLGWRAEIDGRAIGGTLDILPLNQTALGLSSVPDGEPFEGILWNRSFGSAVIARLRRMRVVEAVAEEATCLTYDLEQSTHCFLVEEEEIRPLVPSLGQCLSTLIDHAGAEGVREAMILADWRKQLRSNTSLVRIREK